MAETRVNSSRVHTGHVVQVVSFETGAVATTSTAIPNDDTIPQNTEGAEFMALSITPKSASNKLLIHAKAVLGSAGNGVAIAMALFKDSTASALAATFEHNSSAGTVIASLDHILTSGTTDEITFKIRAGGEVQTTTFNGTASSRKYGGSLASSIIIMEIAA